MTVNAADSAKTIADPNGVYESLQPMWKRSRAVCSGEQAVKDYDTVLDLQTYNNLLIPFSPSMTGAQYSFYKAEAELPGIVAQFARMLVGGLLRKDPTIKLPEGVPEDALDWLNNEFGQDGSTLISFLDAALWEEIQTSRAWLYVDYPAVDEETFAGMDDEERGELRPYPVLWQAESVVNYRTRRVHGREILDMVIVSGQEEVYEDDEAWHPVFKKTVWVHMLDSEGHYVIRKFQSSETISDVPVSVGAVNKQAGTTKAKFEEVTEPLYPLKQGEYLTSIPAWPLNGAINPPVPVLTPLIDKEVSLYNKISRRNHLMYGAATYTPVISTNMTDEEFDKIVGKGLGSWIRLGVEDKIDVLKTPTEPLQDMDRAIAASIEEMAKLGVRMLSPETAQSGVALQLRNAAQTAQLGTLNSKVSAVMSQVITFMLNWRYGLELRVADVEFSLSSDFTPAPLGDAWLRLITEWYQAGLIPRSIWINILKQNDIIAPDYNDKEGVEEITRDADILMGMQTQNDSYASGTSQQKPEKSGAE